MKRTICLLVAFLLHMQIAHAEEASNTNNFFQAIDWELKYLDPNTDQNQSSESTFGLSYSVDYDFLKDSDNRIAFVGKGLIAADKEANPKDFLESQLDIGFDRDFKTKNPYEVKCPDGMADIECKALKKAAENHHNIFTVQLNLDASYESNQDFSEYQYAYGINATYTQRGYSIVNYVFDAPFMVTRWLSGHPMSQKKGIEKTYPGVVPTLKLALEQVDPKDNEARESILGNKDSYDRLNIELGMTTPICMINGKTVNFNYVWRYFNELDAEDVIRDAGLERFEYSSLALVYDGMIYVSYSSGELPFSNTADKVFELGWKFNFGEAKKK